MHLFRFPKYRLVLRPFLLVSLGCLLLSSGLQIIFLRRFEVLPFREDLLRLSPFLLPWIPLAIWVLPGLRRLRYPNWTKGVFGYYGLCVLLIAVPLLILQFYLRQVAGRRVELNIVGEVPRFSSARYYRLGHFYTNAHALRQMFVSRVSGRGGATLEFHQYVLVPMYADSLAQAVSGSPDSTATLITPLFYTPEQRDAYLRDHPPVAWACLHEQQSMSNQSLDVDKTEQWDHFQRAQTAHLETRYWDTVTEWEQVPNDHQRKIYVNVVPKSLNDQLQMLLMPRSIPVETRHLFYLSWVLFAFVGGFIFFWLVIRVTSVR